MLTWSSYLTRLHGHRRLWPAIKPDAPGAAFSCHVILIGHPHFGQSQASKCFCAYALASGSAWHCSRWQGNPVIRMALRNAWSGCAGCCGLGRWKAALTGAPPAEPRSLEYSWLARNARSGENGNRRLPLNQLRCHSHHIQTAAVNVSCAGGMARRHSSLAQSLAAPWRQRRSMCTRCDKELPVARAVCRGNRTQCCLLL